MFSTGPGLPAAAEDMTVEVRDSNGIPYMQARVPARNAGEALAKASTAHPDTRWVFLRELGRHEITQIVRDHSDAGQNDPARLAPAGPSPACTAAPSGTAASPGELGAMG